MDRRRRAQQQQQQQRATPADDPPHSWQQLPRGVLEAVLCCLPQPSDVARAARVCRTWAAAAASVRRLVLPAVQDYAAASRVYARLQRLWAWLAAHGSQVHSVEEVQQREATDPECTEMERRWYYCCTSPSTSLRQDVEWQPALLQPLPLPRLAALRLLQHPLPLCALSPMTALTALQLGVVEKGSQPDSWPDVLARLRGLRRLALKPKACPAGDAAGLAAAIAGLPHLQALRLEGSELVKAACQAALPLGLTQLELWGGVRVQGPAPVLSKQATPHVAALMALRDVRLHDVELEPGMWGTGLCSLTRFEMQGLSCLPAGSRGDEAAAALLCLLRQQSALQHLHIASVPHNILFDVESLTAHEGLPARPPLAAGSLTHLVLDGCLPRLPVGPGGRLLLDAPRLSLAGLTCLELGLGEGEHPAPSRFSCISMGHVCQLLQCCGALQQLTLWRVLFDGLAGTDLSALSQLTGLTRLMVGHARLQLDGLLMLSQLRSLTLVRVPQLDEVDVVDVALHMPQLTRLALKGWDTVPQTVYSAAQDWLHYNSAYHAGEDMPVVVLDSRPVRFSWADDTDDDGSDDEMSPPCQQLKAAMSEDGLWTELAQAARRRAARRAAMPPGA